MTTDQTGSWVRRSFPAERKTDVHLADMKDGEIEHLLNTHATIWTVKLIQSMAKEIRQLLNMCDMKNAQIRGHLQDRVVVLDTQMSEEDADTKNL